MSQANALYDADFVVWTERQGAELRQLAREGSNLPLDWETLAEEIESLGRRDRHDVESFVRLITIHLLKLGFSPAQDTPATWMDEADEFRLQLRQALKDSP